MFSSILHGLLTGFLFPIIPWFFFRELPLPNFFDADAEASGATDAGGASSRVAESVGGEVMPSIVFGKRVQVSVAICGYDQSQADVGRWVYCLVRYSISHLVLCDFSISDLGSACDGPQRVQGEGHVQ